MFPINLSKHCREQMAERGVGEHEIIEAIRSGENLPAKLGRKKFRKNFAFNKEWGGRFYRTKQVVPVTTEEEGVIIVITVLAFYF